MTTHEYASVIDRLMQQYSGRCVHIVDSERMRVSLRINFVVTNKIVTCTVLISELGIRIINGAGAMDLGPYQALISTIATDGDIDHLFSEHFHNLLMLRDLDIEYQRLYPTPNRATIQNETTISGIAISQHDPMINERLRDMAIQNSQHAYPVNGNIIDFPSGQFIVANSSDGISFTDRPDNMVRNVTQPETHDVFISRPDDMLLHSGYRFPNPPTPAVPEQRPEPEVPPAINSLKTRKLKLDD